LRPVEFGALLSVSAGLVLNSACVNDPLFLLGEPWDFSSSTEKEKARNANKDGKSSKEERNSAMSALRRHGLETYPLHGAISLDLVAARPIPYRDRSEMTPKEVDPVPQTMTRRGSSRLV
jgi:hypothetical protein